MKRTAYRGLISGTLPYNGLPHSEPCIYSYILIRRILDRGFVVTDIPEVHLPEMLDKENP